MKEAKRFAALVLVLVMACAALAGCGGRKDKAEVPDTPAGKLYAAFTEEIKHNTDLVSVAEQVMNTEGVLPFACASMEVTPGYLNGFDKDITGFQKGVMFGPIISSIPFVGYVFETDDPEALKAELKENYNLTWNICTSADEMLCESEGNYVFFVMSQTDFAG